MFVCRKSQSLHAGMVEKREDRVEPEGPAVGGGQVQVGSVRGLDPEHSSPLALDKPRILKYENIFNSITQGVFSISGGCEI